jgi:nucleoside-diphosphate-sugar epimerase
MTIALVTGISGFFGSVLADCLALRGYEVFGTTTGTPTPGHYPCDIRDPAQVQSVFERLAPDVVVHCAAISSVTSNPPLDYYETNVIGTENILNAATKLQKPIRFIFISTAGVYGNQKVELLDEGLAPLPVHHYGMSKFCAERLVLMRSDVLDSTIIRPFNIVGPGQHASFIAPKLVAAFASGQRQLKLGNIDVYRDYIDLDLACATVVELIGSARSHGEVVNLCTGVGTSLRELLAILQGIAGYEIEIVSAEEFTRKDEVWKLLGSREKLDRLLGHPLHYAPLDETLRRMFDLARQSSASRG